MASNIHIPMKTRRGMLTFEWALISVLLVVGCLTGLAMLRDAIGQTIVYDGNVVQSLNTSYNAGAYGDFTGQAYTTQVQLTSDEDDED